MEKLKTERLNLALTPEEMKRLQELADANTDRNMSMMVRQLLNRVWEEPDALGFRAPKAVALTA